MIIHIKFIIALLGRMAIPFFLMNDINFVSGQLQPRSE